MVCIQCGFKTQVINSRAQKRLNQVWRRRQCLSCGATFTTEESAQYGANWAVLDSKGTPRPFSRDKLFLSLYNSCQHREQALTDAAALTDTVIKKVLPQIQRGTIPSKSIAQTIQVALNRFDTAASVHYTAFHQQ